MEDLVHHIYDDFIVPTVVAAFDVISHEFEEKQNTKVRWEIPDDPLRDNYIISLTICPEFDEKPDSIFSYVMIIKEAAEKFTVETLYSFDTKNDGMRDAHGRFTGEAIDIKTIESNDIVKDIQNGWDVAMSWSQAGS